MTYEIGEKEFGIHFGMLFQEAWLKLIEGISNKILSGERADESLTDTEVTAFLIYHGNINYSKLNDAKPAFNTMGAVYQFMETNPTSEVYNEISKQYNESQAAQLPAEVSPVHHPNLLGSPDGYVESPDALHL
jgi:hypothetical protein